MTITRAALLTAVGYEYKYALTIKQNDTYEAMQWVADDIAGEFDGFRGLEDKTAAKALTTLIPYVDIATELTGLRHNRISEVSITDSANAGNNRTIDEKDYLDYYLKRVPDPTNLDTAVDYDVPKIYSRYQDNLYFYPIPNLTTLSVIIYFDKVHPTISASQDILYPSDFKQLMVAGVVGILKGFVDRKDGTIRDKLAIYYAMKEDKLRQYVRKPNLKRKMRMNW